MLPLVSIIVPCYKKAQFLPEALDSVSKQTYLNWECIIINDGSPDETETISLSYSHKDSRFKYIYQENKGVSSARNNGIAFSSGEYILPLDADDIIEPTYVEKAINHFINYPSTKLVYCKCDIFGINNFDAENDDYSFDDILWNCMIHCSSVFRRSDFDKTSGYNPEMDIGYEDWDFLLSFLEKDSIVYRIDEYLFHYRITSNSRNISADKQCDKLWIQIYHNHEELYAPYAERIIMYKKMCEREKKHAIEIYNTPSYKLGYRILHPFAKIKRLFNKINTIH